MSVPLLALLKHDAVLPFHPFPNTLEEFFTSDFLSMIGIQEKTDFAALFTDVIKDRIDKAFEDKNRKLFDHCVKEGMEQVLIWGFLTCHGWITLSKGGFEWTSGNSMETTQAAIKAYAAAAKATKATSLKSKKNVVVRRTIRVAKNIAKSKIATKAAEVLDKLSACGTWLKEKTELAQFGLTAVAAGVGCVQLFNGDLSGIPALLGLLPSTRRNRVRPPNLMLAFAPR